MVQQDDSRGHPGRRSVILALTGSRMIGALPWASIRSPLGQNFMPVLRARARAQTEQLAACVDGGRGLASRDVDGRATDSPASIVTLPQWTPLSGSKADNGRGAGRVHGEEPVGFCTAFLPSQLAGAGYEAGPLCCMGRSRRQVCLAVRIGKGYYAPGDGQGGEETLLLSNSLSS